jgi:sec-independent protein translocase protein TatC
MSEEPEEGSGPDPDERRDPGPDASEPTDAADPDPDSDSSPETDAPEPAVRRVDDDPVQEPDGDGVVSPADDPDMPTAADVSGRELRESEPTDAAGSYDGPDPATDVDGEYGVDAKQASDGGYADDGLYDGTVPDQAVPDPTVDDEDLETYEGAPDDQEMPLADHIEEMIRRLGVVVVVMAVVSGVAFPFGTDLINFLWYNYLPGTVAQCPGDASTVGSIAQGGAACPRVYSPLAVVLARLKVATLVGFVVGLPVFVYETYLFMRPGLYPRERRYYLASVPTSLLLALVGMLFAHFIVIPFLFDYFVSYSANATIIAFGLTETFDLIVLLLGSFAIVFQIPLFVMLALMMGLVTRDWLEGRRLIFWGVFAALSFLFAPDPTGMAPIIVAATMIVLFEGTLLLAKWTRRG